MGNIKEDFDYYWNQGYKGLSRSAAEDDRQHDLQVNQIGRERAKKGAYSSSQDACADFRKKNESVPKKYW